MIGLAEGQYVRWSEPEPALVNKVAVVEDEVLADCGPRSDFFETGLRSGGGLKPWPLSRPGQGLVQRHGETSHLSCCTFGCRAVVSSRVRTDPLHNTLTSLPCPSISLVKLQLHCIEHQTPCLGRPLAVRFVKGAVVVVMTEVNNFPTTCLYRRPARPLIIAY